MRRHAVNGLARYADVLVDLVTLPGTGFSALALPVLPESSPNLWHVHWNRLLGEWEDAPRVAAIQPRQPDPFLGTVSRGEVTWGWRSFVDEQSGHDTQLISANGHTERTQPCGPIES